MSLQEAKDEIKSQLQTLLNWQQPIVSEYESSADLPAIMVESAGEAEPVNVRQTAYMYPTTITAALVVNDTAGLEQHRDPLNTAGVAWAAEAMRLQHGTFISQSVEIGTEVDDLDEYNRTEYSWVRVNGELHIFGEPFAPAENGG